MSVSLIEGLPPPSLHRMLANRTRCHSSHWCGHTIIPALAVPRSLLRIQRILPRTVGCSDGVFSPFGSVSEASWPLPLLFVEEVEGFAGDVVFVPIHVRHAYDILGTWYSTEAWWAILGGRRFAVGCRRRRCSVWRFSSSTVLLVREICIVISGSTKYYLIFVVAAIRFI